MMGIERVKKEDFFVRDEGRGRGHSIKLFKTRRIYISHSIDLSIFICFLFIKKKALKVFF